MHRIAFLSLIGLAACGDWPDAGGPPMSRSSDDWPVLLPLDGLVDTGSVPATTDDDASALLNRANALRGRAAILRSDATDMEDLRMRLAR